MNETQTRMAKRRLALGIVNVGFWVTVSLSCLFFIGSSKTSSISRFDLFSVMLGAVVVQSIFDFIGGAVLMPSGFSASRQSIVLLVRGVLVHTFLLCTVGLLSFGSFKLLKGFYLSIAASSLGLFLCRLHILRIVSGVQVRDETIFGSTVLNVDSVDPSFTGGIRGIGSSAIVLLPTRWKADLTDTQFKTVLERRLWEIESFFPMRSFLIVLFWNLLGCGIGSVSLGMPDRSPEAALLLQGCWMTVWAFLGLLLLPTVSRSSVFAADRAASSRGTDVADWIRLFPSITGEDGNARKMIQRIFYPIPSTEERLRQLNDRSLYPTLGNVARTNLFLSLGTMTLLGRCVHCNVGRPELWVYPPSD